MALVLVRVREPELELVLGQALVLAQVLVLAPELALAPRTLRLANRST